ncbi:MAG TPA: class I SAM-dependent methyltransferase [Candidatus Binatia bacterium]|nr:class I SAM-dependent methyltransferase [Candidatus Binatia bacterium]
MLGKLTSVASLWRDPGPRFVWLWWRLRRRVPGWLTTANAALLYGFARNGGGPGEIMEIGSAWGLSTIVLAKGAHARQGEEAMVTTVDTHDTYSGTERRLQRSLTRFRADNVTAITQDSVGYAERSSLPRRIRLLYVDGDHSESGVRRDLEAWLPRVAPGGVVVFDDYFDHSDPGYGVAAGVRPWLDDGTLEPVRRSDLAGWTRKATHQAAHLGDGRHGVNVRGSVMRRSGAVDREAGAAPRA